MYDIPKSPQSDIRVKSEKLQMWVEKQIYTPIASLKIDAWLTPEPVSYKNRTTGTYRKLNIGDVWGKLFDCGWFNFKGKIPANLLNTHLVMDIDFSGEGCVFDKNGVPVRGLTTVSTREDWSLGMWGKTILQIDKKYVADGEISVWIDAACNDLEGQFRGEGKVNKANISICNDELRDFYYDLSIVNGLSDGLFEDNNPYLNKVLSALSETNALFDINKNIEISPLHIRKARSILSEILNTKNDDNPDDYSLTATGHAHIDLLFLWPQRETLRKAARTFSTVLDLMERYPSYPYHFCCSQPQLYLWVKDAYPELYEKIKVKIAEGVWEPQGAMWCETDTNMPSGESLIRQILYGKEFFKSEFGIDMSVGFLPDVFGYSAALPQIFKKSGVDYFTTQKMSWNTVNTFPHHTFMWRGIDGTEILTHMLPEDSYQSQAVPQLAMKGRRRFKNKDVTKEALELFGVGDGGGGPGPEHIERLIRQQNLKGCPKIKQGKITDFFERIGKNVDNYPRWQGELYLERHQGTYTTVSKIKKYNRLMERELKKAEFLSSLAHLNSNFAYPTEKLEKIWKEVLLYQFHDCLPGSSINRVYDEAYERYESLLCELNLIKSAALSTMSGASPCEDSETLFLYNPEAFPRNDWVSIKSEWYKASVPPLSAQVVRLSELELFKKNKEQTIEVNNSFAENHLIKVSLNSSGEIKSIYDKKLNRELLRSPGNQLLSFSDKYDCWDIQTDYRSHPPEHAALVSKTPYIDGPTFGWELVFTIGASTINQKIQLWTDSRRIDFLTNVVWNDEHKMLRTRFPTSINASEAKCETQFGHIPRPTHNNTSWDFAKDEICIQRFADLSDSSYGIAILSDSKYGASVKDNILDLNLIRAQNSPSQNQDIYEHDFIYSILPHEGSLEKSNVKKEAIIVNNPLEVTFLNNSSSDKIVPLFENYEKWDLIEDGIAVECVKLSQNKDSILIRLYEFNNSVNRLPLNAFKSFEICECNLIEMPILKTFGHNIIKTSEFKPFEIKAFLLRKK